MDWWHVEHHDKFNQGPALVNELGVPIPEVQDPLISRCAPSGSLLSSICILSIAASDGLPLDSACDIAVSIVESCRQVSREIVIYSSEFSLISLKILSGRFRDIECGAMKYASKPGC